MANMAFLSDISYEGVQIEISFNIEESKEHLDEDYRVIEQEGIESIIRERFIPWLKGEQFADRDDNLLFEGMKLYYITYSYGRIIAKYSPTGEDAFFGQFEFSFESASEYTEDVFESVAMQIYVYNGKLVKVSGYDV